METSIQSSIFHKSQIKIRMWIDIQKSKHKTKRYARNGDYPVPCAICKFSLAVEELSELLTGSCPRVLRLPRVTSRDTFRFR